MNSAVIGDIRNNIIYRDEGIRDKINNQRIRGDALR